MIRHWGFACLSASLGLSLACEQGSRVEAETRDLAEAQRNTGNVAKDLEVQLDKARAEVVELEKKLALAREGITDEVLEERKELQQALDSQKRELQEDINEAHKEAQALNKDADRAIQQLQQTQPPAQVDTTLKTETDVVPGTPPVEAPVREERVPVRGVDPAPAPEAPDAPPVESTTSTTHSTSPAPADPAPADPAPATPPASEAPTPPPPPVPPNPAPAPVTPVPAP